MVDASLSLLQLTGPCARVAASRRGGPAPSTPSWRWMALLGIPPGAHGSLTERPLLQALQQGEELPALGGVERRQHRVAYLTPQRAHLLPSLTRAGAEFELGRTPVARIGPPREQPFLFQSVDKVRHAPRRHPELRRQAAHAQAPGLF